jgi:hypothetical protein
MEVLQGYRMAQSTERELQGAIEEALRIEGFDFQREPKLTAHDRPDFLVVPGVAVEVKIMGPVAAVRRQIARYAEIEGVEVVLLVTTHRDHVVPETLEGKPVLSVYVGSAFL